MKRILLKLIKNFGFLAAGLFVLFLASVVIWVSLIQIPDFKSFEDRKVIKSTKIYDRTGEVVLYDVYENVKRTVIPLSEMGVNIKNATVAIEDTEFYQHEGIRIKSIMRAFWANVIRGGFSQGGSTITQQLIKNTLLTREKTLTRKLKEWILSIKIEGVLDKDEILESYLNEAPYGGVVYGIAEASSAFFGKNAEDLTLSEAAYLAALPKAPTRYSPYGKKRSELDQRKNIILKRMNDLGFIAEEEYLAAREEEVVFKPEQKIKIKAPHFVFFIKDYLERKYGAGAMEEGLKVITTLDYELQEKAEEIVARIAKENEKNFNGKNAGLLALDPATGQILAMVGSRDYFDQDVDGAYNVTLAKRQPGSAFKPFIYAVAFNEGYTPDTILFDVKTEFQTTCDPSTSLAMPGYKQEDCYSPSNYDNKFRGPMTVRHALAESINVPAVKMLYLVGVADAIRLARDMGINTLEDPGRYGLTLVIGGGEVTLMDMVSAFGSFAGKGVRKDPKWVLKIEDSQGKITEEFKETLGRKVLPENTALMISDILSDNQARIGTFGARSVLEIPGAQVAVKTGTTNNNRDAWTIGYTPAVVVGVWVGNNDNTPMKKGGAALAGPIWNAFIKEALKKYPPEPFEKPDLALDPSLPPIIRGNWFGGESFFIDKISGKLATEKTPKETLEEKVITNVHDILYWIDKNNPRVKKDPLDTSDRQLERWEIPTGAWWEQNKYKFNLVTEASKPIAYDDIHTEEKSPKIEVSGLDLNRVYAPDEQISLLVNASGAYQIKKMDVFLNDTLLKSSSGSSLSFSFTPRDIENLNEENEIKIIAQDVVYNSSQQVLDLKISASL